MFQVFVRDLSLAGPATKYSKNLNFLSFILPHRTMPMMGVNITIIG
jgi:hypothetical protein